MHKPIKSVTLARDEDPLRGGGAETTPHWPPRGGRDPHPNIGTRASMPRAGSPPAQPAPSVFAELRSFSPPARPKAPMPEEASPNSPRPQRRLSSRRGVTSPRPEREGSHASASWALNFVSHAKRYAAQAATSASSAASQWLANENRHATAEEGPEEWTKPIPEASELPLRLFPAEKLVLVADRCDATTIGHERGFSGALAFSNYRIVFIPADRDAVPAWMTDSGFWSFPIGVIEAFEVMHVGKIRPGEKIFADVTAKDTRKVKFAISGETQPKAMMHKFDEILCPLTVTETFPFLHGTGEGDPLRGWDVFTLEGEYARMLGRDAPPIRDGHTAYDKDRYDERVDDEDEGTGFGDGTKIPLRISYANRAYGLCATYPPAVVVPATLSDASLAKIAAFRSKSRLPILAWTHPATNATLWRCSQPRSAFNRCREDEFFFSMVADFQPKRWQSLDDNEPLPVLIVDARPRIYAMVNKATGAGFENTTTNYKRCQLEFGNIDNIHAVRDSTSRMASAIRCSLGYNEPPKDYPSGGNGNGGEIVRRSWDMSKFWIDAGYSQYYEHVALLLVTANRVARRLRQGAAVVIHCSDGWDRTAQLTSLAMLMCDPFYRTLNGFIALIEKEFLFSGHKFHTRQGHPGQIPAATTAFPSFSPKSQVGVFDDAKDDESQRSPIFNQWLNCVYQIMLQHPTHFEYTQAVLIVIAEAAAAAYYGTFLLNSHEQRVRLRVHRFCRSLWDDLLSAVADPQRSESLVNRDWRPLPPPLDASGYLPPPLDVATDPFSIRIWEGFWSRFHPLRKLNSEVRVP
eukprot:Polyplicarium_translucidae@DN2799_c0_g1_i2.p1